MDLVVPASSHLRPYFDMSAFHAVIPCDCVTADRPERCLSLNWHSVFRHALSRINNLLHNILVWTGGEIPADWNMWRSFDCVDPHFPFLLRSLPPVVLLLFPPCPCISPNPSLPLHTLQESSQAGSQIQTRVDQAFLQCAQTCSQAERQTHVGNSWWLSSNFYSDKWHKHFGVVMEIVWLYTVSQTIMCYGLLLLLTLYACFPWTAATWKDLIWIGLSMCWHTIWC